MSLFFTGLRRTIATLRCGLTNRSLPARCIFSTPTFRDEESEQSEDTENTKRTKPVDPSKDRTKVIPVETSIRYLQSKAYNETYGNEPVWKPYRRNHKGQFPPRKTRKTCIRGGVIATGNPCPICRDEYLILDHRNVKLLKQFISEFNGEVLSYRKTGVCQRKHQELLVAIHKAKDYGTITFDVPFRHYNYADWYKPQSEA